MGFMINLLQNNGININLDKNKIKKIKKRNDGDWVVAYDRNWAHLKV